MDRRTAPPPTAQLPGSAGCEDGHTEHEPQSSLTPQFARHPPSYPCGHTSPHPPLLPCLRVGSHSDYCPRAHMRPRIPCHHPDALLSSLYLEDTSRHTLTRTPSLTPTLTRLHCVLTRLSSQTRSIFPPHTHACAQTHARGALACAHARLTLGGRLHTLCGVYLLFGCVFLRGRLHSLAQ